MQNLVKITAYHIRKTTVKSAWEQRLWLAGWLWLTVISLNMVPFSVPQTANMGCSKNSKNKRCLQLVWVCYFPPIVRWRLNISTPSQFRTEQKSPKFSSQCFCERWGLWGRWKILLIMTLKKRSPSGDSRSWCLWF